MEKFYFSKFALSLLLMIGAAANSFAQNVAKIGDVEYATLADAVAAAEEGQTVTMIADADVAEMIPVTKTMTLDLASHTITNNVTVNRLFRLSNITFTIEGNNGKFIIPSANETSYGFVDFRDASNTAGANTKLIARNAYFEGATNEGVVFALRGGGQAVDFENVSVNLTGGYTYSIINGYGVQVDIKVKGGTYTCNSTHSTAGVFQAGPLSTIDFEGVTVNTSVGPIFEVLRGSVAKFKNCTMTNTATNGYFATCIASSNGSNITVEGGSYEANYALYVYSSGGTINANGGTFKGKVAAVQVDRVNDKASPATVNINDGTFEGSVINNGVKSTLNINGGKITGKVENKGASSTTVISGGTIDGDVTATGANSTIEVKGGTVTGTMSSNSNNGSAIIVSGGDGDVYKANDKGEGAFVTFGEDTKELTLDHSDLSALRVNKDVENVNVTYNRSFTADKWVDFFVPFDVTLTSDLLKDYSFAKLWDTELVNGATTIECMVLEEGAVLTANTPYIIKAKAEGDQTLTFTGVTLKQTPESDLPALDCASIEQTFKFYGVYSNTTLLDKNGYYLDPATTTLKAVTNPTAWVSPLRFYMTVQNKSDNSYDYPAGGNMKAIKMRVIGGGEGTTGIENVNPAKEQGKTTVYTLQGTVAGTSLEGLKAGIYIVNGNKVIVK